MKGIICAICGADQGIVEYEGKIRMGRHDWFTEDDVKIYYCPKCKVRWHEYCLPEDYYESEIYWSNVIGGNEESEYVKKAYDRWGDKVLECLNYIGTERLYDKVVMDFGCAEGMLLDYIRGGARKTIGIELNRKMQEHLRKKGHEVYGSLKEAVDEYANQVDVLVSFDVIEHVEDPQNVLKQLWSLLKPGGEVILGTPTDSPVLRELIGREFEQFLFHVGHPWIFSEESLELCFKRAGFRDIKVENVYKYSIGNVLGWLQDGRAVGNKRYRFVTGLLESVWKSEMEKQKLGEYLVVYARK